MATFLALPWVVEYVVRIAPPHLFLSQRVFLTSTIGFLSVMICYATNYRTGATALTRYTLWFGAAGLLAIVAYWAIVLSWSEYNPPERERVVIGYAKKSFVLELQAEDQQLTINELLQNAKWNP